MNNGVKEAMKMSKSKVEWIAQINLKIILWLMIINQVIKL